MKYFNITKGSLPNPGEKVSIDTQIIYWLFYADDNYLIGNRPYQIRLYSKYLEDIMQNKNKIIIFGGVIQELFKIIEINEYKLYLKLNDFSENDMSLKQYRKIPDERKCVQNKINIAYKQIQQIADINYDAIDNICCNDFIGSFLVHKADLVDFSLVHFCKKENINHLLTDDFDFKTIDNDDINIFSANKSYFV